MDKKTRITPDFVSTLGNDEIFVFGSNLEGRHLGGAARTALKWGAIMGQGVGLQGKTYAIPTMFNTVGEIKPYVSMFISFAKSHPEYRFLVTEIGCGIAGFAKEEIAVLFKAVIQEGIENVYLPRDFLILITRNEKIG